MKTVKVKYIFEVTRNVKISGDTPPDPYDKDEWEKQQIENIGNDMEFNLDGEIYWYYQTL